MSTEQMMTRRERRIKEAAEHAFQHRSTNRGEDHPVMLESTPEPKHTEDLIVEEHDGDKSYEEQYPPLDEAELESSLPHHEQQPAAEQHGLHALLHRSPEQSHPKHPRTTFATQEDVRRAAGNLAEQLEAEIAEEDRAQDHAEFSAASEQARDEHDEAVARVNEEFASTPMVKYPERKTHFSYSNNRRMIAAGRLKNRAEQNLGIEHDPEPDEPIDLTNVTAQDIRQAAENLEHPASRSTDLGVEDGDERLLNLKNPASRSARPPKFYPDPRKLGLRVVGTSKTVKATTLATVCLVLGAAIMLALVIYAAIMSLLGWATNPATLGFIIFGSAGALVLAFAAWVCWMAEEES